MNSINVNLFNVTLKYLLLFQHQIKLIKQIIISKLALVQVEIMKDVNANLIYHVALTWIFAVQKYKTINHTSSDHIVLKYQMLIITMDKTFFC